MDRSILYYPVVSAGEKVSLPAATTSKPSAEQKPTAHSEASALKVSEKPFAPEPVSTKSQETQKLAPTEQRPRSQSKQKSQPEKKAPVVQAPVEEESDNESVGSTDDLTPSTHVESAKVSTPLKKPEERPADALKEIWTVWSDAPESKSAGKASMTKNEFEQRIKNEGDFGREADFEPLWEKVKSEIEEGQYVNLRVFKWGIEPLWEDKSNADGGKWTMFLDDKQWRQSEAIAFFHVVVRVLISGWLDDNNDICGVVFTIKGKGFHISIWNKRARAVEDKSALTEEFNSHPLVASFLKQTFKSDVPKIELSYRPHKLSKSGHKGESRKHKPFVAQLPKKDQHSTSSPPIPTPAPVTTPTVATSLPQEPAGPVKKVKNKDRVNPWGKSEPADEEPEAVPEPEPVKPAPVAQEKPVEKHTEKQQTEKKQEKPQKPVVETTKSEKKPAAKPTKGNPWGKSESGDAPKPEEDSFGSESLVTPSTTPVHSEALSKDLLKHSGDEKKSELQPSAKAVQRPKTPVQQTTATVTAPSQPATKSTVPAPAKVEKPEPIIVQLESPQSQSPRSDSDGFVHVNDESHPVLPGAKKPAKKSATVWDAAPRAIKSPPRQKEPSLQQPRAVSGGRRGKSPAVQHPTDQFTAPPISDSLQHHEDWKPDVLKKKPRRPRTPGGSGTFSESDVSAPPSPIKPPVKPEVSTKPATTLAPASQPARKDPTPTRTHPGEKKEEQPRSTSTSKADTRAVSTGKSAPEKKHETKPAETKKSEPVKTAEVAKSADTKTDTKSKTEKTDTKPAAAKTEVPKVNVADVKKTEGQEEWAEQSARRRPKSNTNTDNTSSEQSQQVPSVPTAGGVRASNAFAALMNAQSPPQPARRIEPTSETAADRVITPPVRTTSPPQPGSAGSATTKPKVKKDKKDRKDKSSSHKSAASAGGLSLAVIGGGVAAAVFGGLAIAWGAGIFS